MKTVILILVVAAAIFFCVKKLKQRKEERELQEMDNLRQEDESNAYQKYRQLTGHDYCADIQIYPEIPFKSSYPSSYNSYYEDEEYNALQVTVKLLYNELYRSYLLKLVGVQYNPIPEELVAKFIREFDIDVSRFFQKHGTEREWKEFLAQSARTY